MSDTPPTPPAEDSPPEPLEDEPPPADRPEVGTSPSSVDRASRISTR